jgi:hypothetical protein
MWQLLDPLMQISASFKLWSSACKEKINIKKLVPLMMLDL